MYGSPSAPLPTYSVRESARARRVLLRVRPNRGLEVVVPPRFDQGRIPAIVARRSDWIARAFARYGIAPDGAPAPGDLPQFLEFPAFGERVEVDYSLGPNRRIRIRPNADRLLISGPDGDRNVVLAGLREHLKSRARTLLPPLARELSSRCGLEFEGLTVRLQKSRWGSCSAKKGISLNAKLLFLPGELVEYVLLHELCHTRHLNHSKAYWKLVARLCPAFRELEADLRQGWRFVPSWVEC